ncbi:hypothetical protein VI817_004440 [Penicillium citrinum]|nr:hypothetical protein VI817_004440 [Penicillium citrinum]
MPRPNRAAIKVDAVMLPNSQPPPIGLAYAIPRPMSFGRHACRHALKPASTPSLDYMWISDDLLATTFRRFANGQRRHGSCVPGPLEARRRLAKRRNTALAGIGAGPPEDIACLFGRNGREHLMWTENPWQRTQFDQGAFSSADRTQQTSESDSWKGLSSHAIGTPDHALPFHDPQPESPDFIIPNNPSAAFNNPDPTTRAQALQKFLDHNNWDIEDARDFIRRLHIDLHREPEFSRQIFDHIIQHSLGDLTQAIAFLEDPFLNTYGSGNYIAAVKLFAQSKRKRSRRIAVLNAVARGLELGLVPTNELCLIIQTLPRILIERNKTLDAWDQKALSKHNRTLWKAIGKCNILGYHDLDRQVTDTWLEELVRVGNLRFAEEIVIATHHMGSNEMWPSTLVLERLKSTDGIDETMFKRVGQFLDQIDPNIAATCIITVTEHLASISSDNETRHQLLNRWRNCLLQTTAASGIATSKIWSDMPVAYMHIPDEHSALGLPIQSQIILRLWILRTLSRTWGPLYNQSFRETDLPISLLLNLYETTTQRTDGSFLSDFMQGIHRLNLPFNSLLLLAVDLKLGKLTSKATRETLERLETAQISLTEIWTDHSAYRRIRGLFHGTFEQMFRNMDITSPASVEECLHLARVGDSKDVWSVLRLLDNHTPMKLCLHKAWVPLPHPDEKALVRYHPEPRDSKSPDPYLAVDFIHQLAVVFSCCKQLNPSRSFHLVHWLYDYLRRHGGPVHPSLVRAMYHAGVVRYRREGRRVSPTQYEYILWIAKKFEGPGVVRELVNGPVIARGRPIQYEES